MDCPKHLERSLHTNQRQHVERRAEPILLTQSADPRPLQRRLLFLLPFAPRLDAMHGGSRVMAQFLTRLAPRHELALLYLRAAAEPPLDPILQARCALVEEVRRPSIDHSWIARWARRARLVAGLARGRPLWVTDWSVRAYASHVRRLVERWKPDLVQMEYHMMAQYLPALAASPAPRILTEYEPGVRAGPYLQASLGLAARILNNIDRRVWQCFEPAIIQRVQTVVVLTEHDRQTIAPIAPHTPVVRIPFGITIPDESLNALGSSPLSLLFVGSFIHPPNLDAAQRLIHDIFPRVQTQFPQLVLNVVGDQPPPEIRRMAHKHIRVTGRVPDVTLYMDSAALVVVPVRLGGGMRVKVLEALAAGKVVVASRLAIEGLAVKDGEQVMLAESDDEFCDVIVRLLRDPEKRQSLATRARAWACTHLTWEQAISAYESLYTQLIENARHAEATR